MALAVFVFADEMDTCRFSNAVADGDGVFLLSPGEGSGMPLLVAPQGTFIQKGSSPDLPSENAVNSSA